MKRLLDVLLPAPLLSASLLVLWLVLAGSLEAAHWLMGALLAWLAPLLTQSLRPTPARIGRPWVIARLIACVGWDVLIWNLRVAGGVWRRRMPRGGFIVVPLELRDPNGLAALVMILSVVPGTVWSELSPERDQLLVHIFDLHDAEAEIHAIQQRYEKPLLEIFQ
jgi:multicomponent K+:H+ antiporter subunit E